MTEESPMQSPTSECVPESELREIIEEWQRRANERPMDDGRDNALRECAGELEALLE